MGIYIYICTYTLFYIMYNIIQNVHMFISWNTIIHMYYIYVSICTIMLCYVIISYYHLIGTHTYIYVIICYYILSYLLMGMHNGFYKWGYNGIFLMGYIIILYQKRLLPALKSPIVCVDSLFFVDILHYLMFFVVHSEAFSIRNTTGLLWARKRQFVSPNTFITLH